MTKTQKQMLDQLLQVARDVGQPPSIKEINRAARQGKCPTDMAYRQHFGSYTAAVRAAGLDPTARHKIRYDPERLIKDLQNYAKKLGRSPTIADIYQGSRDGECAAYNTYRAHFGKLPGILKAANLPPVPDQRGLRKRRRLKG